MKRLLWILPLMFLVACAVADPTPPTALGQTLVAMPEELNVLIWTLVSAGLTWLLAKINMGYLTAQIAAIVAPLIVTAVGLFLQTIPSLFDAPLLAFIHFVVVAVGSLGVFVVLKKRVKPTVLPVG